MTVGKWLPKAPIKALELVRERKKAGLGLKVFASSSTDHTFGSHMGLQKCKGSLEVYWAS